MCTPTSSHPSPGPESPAPPKAPANPCPPDPEYHLHVDADRDGQVDASRDGLDRWEWGKGKKGAIIFCNNDLDGGGSFADNQDKEVNTGNDADEIAPLVIRRKGGAPPAGWTGMLEVAPSDKDLIRIFESRKQGAREVIGPDRGNRYILPDLDFAEKELGMEATQYADEDWSGEIKIRFTLTKPSGTVVEEAVVRVAPWMMSNHLAAAKVVYVAEVPTDRPPGDPDRTGDNSRYRHDLESAVMLARCILSTYKPPDNDRWLQDCMELGYSNLPKAGISVVIQSPRDRPLKDFPKTLHHADIGYEEAHWMMLASTFNSFGNLECSPPVTSEAGKKYELGRIYYGPGRPKERMNRWLRGLLKAQVVQDPVEIDTDWLTVGHVDEITTFVPAPDGQGFRLILASPKLAYDILQANKTKNGTSKLLVGRKFPMFNFTGRVFLGWASAEVSINTFLDIGILPMGLTATQLKKTNDLAQSRLDGVRATMKKEFGLADSDILEAPVLYLPNPRRPNQVDALTTGIVNMLVINKHCVVPQPFGPVVGGKDLFQDDLDKKLKDLGNTPHFIDDWYEYHVLNGEVHCSSNTARELVLAKWWEHEP